MEPHGLPNNSGLRPNLIAVVSPADVGLPAVERAGCGSQVLPLHSLDRPSLRRGAGAGGKGARLRAGA